MMPAKPKPAAPPPPPKFVRLELPGDVHQSFRVEAAKEGVSMAAVARALVERWLAERGAAAAK